MKTFKNIRRNKGITLIEVLVTVIVLAFGLLGLAGLQANSLKNNHSAFLRSQATYLAYEIIDRMRANRVEAIDNESYDIDSATYNIFTSVTNTTPKSAAATHTKTDLNAWIASLSALPSGEGGIDCNTAENICRVVVVWNDTRAAGGSQQFDMSAEL